MDLSLVAIFLQIAAPIVAVGFALVCLARWARRRERRFIINLPDSANPDWLQLLRRRDYRLAAEAFFLAPVSSFESRLGTALALAVIGFIVFVFALVAHLASTHG